MFVSVVAGVALVVVCCLLKKLRNHVAGVVIGFTLGYVVLNLVGWLCWYGSDVTVLRPRWWAFTFTFLTLVCGALGWWMSTKWLTTFIIYGTSFTGAFMVGDAVWTILFCVNSGVYTTVPMIIRVVCIVVFIVAGVLYQSRH